ncbi:hypothetical protein [Parasitella parasitica]|uniref:Cas12f1-like TNB domain-containing protein n=1 Tax=Parasitella parasitica TaxID=35722 RepID=A0A0B7NJV9_9FUNG|nr:hypothetical protein [Parasitella parasitica]
MQTNGYYVEFTFKKKLVKKSTSKPLTTADFCEDIKNNQFLIWGVDPGVTDIYTAADSGDASKRERIKRTSCKEYYHICGFNLAKQKRMQHQNNNLQDFDFISKLPILKTSNLIDFVNAAAQRLINYQRTSAYYNYDNCSIGEKKQTSTIDKWILSPPKDKATDSSVKTRIIAYGNASFGTSMKGKLPASSKRITEAVKKLSKDSKGTYLVYVDEYLTSQTCNKCRQQKLTNLNAAGSKRKVHAVLKCNSCDTVWNRDVMASKNIYFIMHYMSQHNNERPPEFARTSDTTESITCMRSP